MSLFNRQQTACKPVIGERRIDKVTNKGGETHYEVWRYEYDYDSYYWHPEKHDFESFDAAKSYVDGEILKEEASREAVWP